MLQADAVFSGHTLQLPDIIGSDLWTKFWLTVTHQEIRLRVWEYVDCCPGTFFLAMIVSSNLLVILSQIWYIDVESFYP